MSDPSPISDGHYVKLTLCKSYWMCQRKARYEYRSMSGETVIPLCNFHKDVVPRLYLHRLQERQLSIMTDILGGSDV
jgi:hypothetical protein